MSTFDSDGLIQGRHPTSSLVLHGGTPVKKRQGLVKSFQEDVRGE